MKHWLIYFGIKIPLFIDMMNHGPIITFISAVTGLPIK